MKSAQVFLSVNVLFVVYVRVCLRKDAVAMCVYVIPVVVVVSVVVLLLSEVPLWQPENIYEAM